MLGGGRRRASTALQDECSIAKGVALELISGTYGCISHVISVDKEFS